MGSDGTAIEQDCDVVVVAGVDEALGEHVSELAQAQVPVGGQRGGDVGGLDVE